MSTSSSHLFAKDLLTTPRKKAHVRRQTGRHREKKYMSPSSTCPRQAAGRAEKNPHTSAGRRPREKDPYTSAQRRPREKKSAHVPCRRRRPGWERVRFFLWKSSRDDFWHRSLSPGGPPPWWGPPP
eukprot:gene11801-biopygen22919